MNEFTDEVLAQINRWLLIEMESCIRVRRSGEAVKIGLVGEDFIDDTQSIYPTNEFYKALEEFLISRCNIVDVQYNNTKTSFWKFSDLPQAIKATEQPSEAVAEEQVYGNDCRNGQC